MDFLEAISETLFALLDGVNDFFRPPPAGGLLGFLDFLKLALVIGSSGELSPSFLGHWTPISRR